MTSVIENIARAACREECHAPLCVDPAECIGWSQYMPNWAVLDALAEPTPEMIEAGRSAAMNAWKLSRTDLPNGSEIVRAVWGAMLNEARK